MFGSGNVEIIRTEIVSGYDWEYVRTYGYRLTMGFVRCYPCKEDRPMRT
jgi:hypothetical protein